jgi:hypothetical protein
LCFRWCWATHHGLNTLNPVPHIQRSPIGMVIVPLLSFVSSMASGGWMIGWASTPYDPYWAQAYPKQAALKTLAGPAANLVLMLIAGTLSFTSAFRRGFSIRLHRLPLHGSSRPPATALSQGWRSWSVSCLR